MNRTAYLTPQEYMFQIPGRLVALFYLEVGEHRDIESQNYYIDFHVLYEKFALYGLWARAHGFLAKPSNEKIILIE